MPPKRKRADAGVSEAGSTSTRATRSSTRATRSRAATDETEGTPGTDSLGSTAPQAKRVRKTTTKAAAARTSAKPKVPPDTQEPRADVSTQEATSTTAAIPAKPAKPSAPAPYSAASAISLFNSYADPDDPTVIGPEGFERLCSDAEISLEGALPLILAWQLHASEMANITKSEWEKTTSELRISNLTSLSTALHDLEDLLLLDKPALRPQVADPFPAAKKKSAVSSPASSDPYNRSRYYGYTSDTSKAFNELYAFCFALAKPPQARNIDMETASAFWSVLLVPKYPLMADILQFINEKGTYKGANKDLWTMAWPTTLDDFVAWKSSKSSGDAPVQIDD
ncbi:hypothetical protein EVJ58_g7019 [Rhodofomes roseus]|uniref:Defective in cullin neddylation protein n=1 Tax=Rhodofomes roseus TaxID=34475 RepID=A0A4Y9Y5W8_9APHY|nr:hypothetical protein EVJ58_g7019 [Rhodofomes roseus]